MLSMKAIMYHYVRPDNPKHPYFRHLHLDNFIRQLDYFGNEFGFIDQCTFLECLESNRPADGVILTFDDGFKDHYRYVLPELRKRNLWGIFYIPTAPYFDKYLLDVHRIHLLLGTYGGKIIGERIRNQINDNMLSHEHIDEFHKLTYTKQTNDSSTEYVKRMLNYFIDYRYRAEVIDQLMSDFYPDEEALIDEYYMSPQELKCMISEGMTIGSHTVSHPVMSKLEPQEQNNEIKTSFENLEAMIGPLNTRTFCYPYGGFHTFTTETESLLHQHNVRFSFNVESRDIAASDLRSRSQALPRYDCNEFPHGSCRQIIQR